MIAFFKKRVVVENKVERKFTIIRNTFNEFEASGEVLVELPPSRRTIFVNGNTSESYFVSLPRIRLNFSYYHNPLRKSNFVVQRTYLSFFKRGIFGDQLLIPSFPNLNEQCYLCISGEQGSALEEMIENQVKNFFSSSFDLRHINPVMHFYYSFRFFNFHSYMKRWEKKTKKRPKWINNNFRKIRLFASKRFPQFF